MPTLGGDVIPPPVASITPLAYTGPMIEKVGYTRPITNARPVRKAGSVAAPGFADALAAAEGVGGVEGVEAASPVNTVGTMGGLLGAQEVDEREARRHKAMKQGRLTLEALEKLRDALLMGTLPLTTLQQLEHMVAQQRAEATDPLLKQILNEIELRAVVELAKLEMSGVRLPPPAQP